jgi:CTP:molybdopterin cytidylyltransferase MocA
VAFLLPLATDAPQVAGVGTVGWVTVLGAVLAAGAGERFARSGGAGAKPRAVVAGEALVARAARMAVAAGLDEVVVVQGAVDLTDLLPVGIGALTNRRWDDGIATSLQVAVVHARSAGHAAVVIGLADQPGIPAEAWTAVAAAPNEPPIAVATYGGRRANPVRLAAAAWDLLPVTGDEGARALMRGRPELVREVPCIGEAHDVDTLEDLRRWS